jgi:hypothetical protein
MEIRDLTSQRDFVNVRHFSTAFDVASRIFRVTTMADVGGIVRMAKIGTVLALVKLAKLDPHNRSASEQWIVDKVDHVLESGSNVMAGHLDCTWSSCDTGAMLLVEDSDSIPKLRNRQKAFQALLDRGVKLARTIFNTEPNPLSTDTRYIHQDGTVFDLKFVKADDQPITRFKRAYEVRRTEDFDLAVRSYQDEINKLRRSQAMPAPFLTTQMLEENKAWVASPRRDELEVSFLSSFTTTKGMIYEYRGEGTQVLMLKEKYHLTIKNVVFTCIFDICGKFRKLSLRNFKRPSLVPSWHGSPRACIGSSKIVVNHPLDGAQLLNIIEKVPELLSTINFTSLQINWNPRSKKIAAWRELKVLAEHAYSREVDYEKFLDCFEGDREVAKEGVWGITPDMPSVTFNSDTEG